MIKYRRTTGLPFPFHQESTIFTTVLSTINDLNINLPPSNSSAMILGREKVFITTLMFAIESYLLQPPRASPIDIFRQSTTAPDAEINPRGPFWQGIMIIGRQYGNGRCLNRAN